MIQKLLFVFCLWLPIGILYAQTDSTVIKQTRTDTSKKVHADTIKYWKRGGFSVLTFNQVKFRNWSAGGENAFSTSGVFNVFGNYKKGSIVWDNSLDLGYGIMMNDHKEIRKNEDKIDLNSKVGYKAFAKFYYSTIFNYHTQFSNGYNYPNDSVVVSKFNAPGYISLGIGLDFKPADYFSVSLSPITGKLTIVDSKALSGIGAYGVDTGKLARFEFGANLNSRFQKDIVKNVNVLSKLVLFNNYTDKHKPNRKNIDVNWEVMINIKASKYLTTSIFTDLVYDQNVIARTQFKEVFGIGFSFKY
jgi:hypothetical protein